MEISLLLAQIIGLLFILDGIVSLTKLKEIGSMVYELKNHKGELVFFGFIMFILGIIVVTTHNVWSGSAFQIIITLVGWCLVLKSLFVIVMPHQTVLKVIDKLNKPGFYKTYGVIAIVLGLWLAISGFTL